MNGLARGFSGLLVTVVLTVGPANVWAGAGVQLARTKQCLACHQVDTKRVGPSFVVIAERYADASGAQQYLADTIRQGSRGKWGAIPMPAQPQVSPLDATDLAAWILSLDKPSDNPAVGY